jgi:hypothetical protein
MTEKMTVKLYKVIGTGCDDERTGAHLRSSGPAIVRSLSYTDKKDISFTRVAYNGRERC